MNLPKMMLKEYRCNNSQIFCQSKRHIQGVSTPGDKSKSPKKEEKL
jgi:hypothetical protein